MQPSGGLLRCSSELVLVVFVLEEFGIATAASLMMCGKAMSNKETVV